jgi:hypothetical protein
MPGDDHPGAAVLLAPAHRPQSRLETTVIGLDPVVGLPIGAMPRARQQFLQHHRTGRRAVGRDLARRRLGCAERPLEAPPCTGAVAPRPSEHVDDLPCLVDRAVDIPPAAGDLHLGLVDLPAIADLVPAGPGGLSQQRREPQVPAGDSDVVDLDPGARRAVPRRRGRTTRSAGTSGRPGRSPRAGSRSQRRQAAEQEQGESTGFS